MMLLVVCLYFFLILETLSAVHHHMENAELTLRSDVNLKQAADKNVIHEVCFAIKQRNVDLLIDIVNDISSPKSPNYGKHWSRQKVADFTSNLAALDMLKVYLKKNYDDAKIVRETRYGDYVFVNASVKTWETLFNTEFFVFTVGNSSNHYSVTEPRFIIRALHYDLPEELTDAVSAVFKTVQFPFMHTDPPKLTREKVKLKNSFETVEFMHLGFESSLRGSLANGPTASSDHTPIIFDGYVTPDLIKSFYHMNVDIGDDSVSQVVFETVNDALNPDDLTTFQRIFELFVQPISDNIGGHVSKKACSEYADCYESNLDVQYIMGVAQNIPTIYWYTDDDWLTWITQVADIKEVYDVYSISYGQYELVLSKSIANSFDNEAIKLAAVGSTIFCSSGDDGVVGPIGRGLPSFCGYYPQFPASSPYVTSVGGTQGPESGLSEVTCTTNIVRGGGGSLRNILVLHGKIQR